ncbi:MAG: hypothetical protein P9M14_04320 [Candidatus Alcyoniella australis]|nr:hypothetical protein [Candidatus Alcyoniella australis]
MEHELEPTTPMRVRILINANAKAVRYGRIPIELFNRYLSDRVSLRITEAVDQIDDAINECWESDQQVVLLATGDGGLHRFLSSFVKVYGQRHLEGGALKPLPVFATLRTGTANLITGLLGVKGKPIIAMQRLFDRLYEVRSTADLPLIKQKLLAVSDGIQERFGFIAGTGLLYNFFLEYYQGTRHSLLKFFKIFSRMLLSLFTGTGYLNRLLTSMEARLQLDERRSRLSQWKMMAVSTVETRVVFFRAFKLDRLAEKVHVKAGNPSRLAIMRNLPNLLLNRSLKGRELLDQLARRVHYERETEFGYTIDGELYNACSLTLQAGPEVCFVRL